MEVSKAWLRTQVTGLTGMTAALFAHPGITEVDDTARDLEFQSYPGPDELIQNLQNSEPQIQNFIASHRNHITGASPRRSRKARCLLSRCFSKRRRLA